MSEESIKSGELEARIITSEEELKKAYYLRHQVYSQELNWVKSVNGLESDEYDSNAVHFGCFDSDDLIFYWRAIMPEYEFMLEKEDAFRKVLGGLQLHNRENSIEVTRFCAKSNRRSNAKKTGQGEFTPAVLLGKKLYRFCNENDLRYIYGITTPDFLNVLSFMSGFVIDKIGDAKLMDDGVYAQVLCFDWRKFEEENKKNRPKLLEFYQS